MDKDTQDISKSLSFIIEHMATKDDVREIVHEMIDELVPPIVQTIVQTTVQSIVKKVVQEVVQDALRPIEAKLSGIDKRLDIEAGYRDDMKIPGRVSDLEAKVFGKSREPEILAT